MRLRIGGITDLKMGYNNAGTLTWLDIPYGNAFSMTNNTQNITYEGDNTSQEFFSTNDLSGTLGADKLSDDVLLKAFNKTAVTSATHSTISSTINKRIYFGENAEFTAAPVAFVGTAAAVDEAQDPERSLFLDIYIFKANVRPFKPGDLANRQKQVFNFEWTARKTTTDVAGTGLVGVPADGATFALDLRHYNP